MRFPFDEELSNGVRRRTFSADVNPEELIWHRDDEDRYVKVVESQNWYFQNDGELPQMLRPGDVLFIQRGTWHRVINRGSSRLVVEIHSD